MPTLLGILRWALPAAVPTQECLSCCERFPCNELICAENSGTQHERNDGPSSSCDKGCAHRFCRPCLRTYVVGALRARTYPVPCPMGASACGHVFDHDMLAELLGQGNQEAVQDLARLEAAASIGPGLLTFCPHKDCSEPMLRPEDESELPLDELATCPACHRGFCPHCMVPGWHQGYTCAQFQALPPHQRTAEDAAVLQLSASQRWKPCPGCRHVVERSEGCNHMHCRCGTHFCYKCGAAYTKAADGRSRGNPACTCGLFDVPPEADTAAAAGGQAPRAQQAAPRRRMLQLWDRCREQPMGWRRLLLRTRAT